MKDEIRKAGQAILNEFSACYLENDRRLTMDLFWREDLFTQFEQWMDTYTAGDPY